MFHDTTQSCWMQCFQGLIWIFEHGKFFKTNLNITINNTKYNFLCLKCLLFCNFNQIGTPTAINSMYSLFTTDKNYRKLVLSTVVEYVRRFVSLASNHKISEMHVSMEGRCAMRIAKCLECELLNAKCELLNDKCELPIDKC